jgi:branched-chain amino acid aminotransferase
MSRVVYFNGLFVPERKARVSIYDSALLLGDMAFEVTRTIRGRPFRLREHLQRLWHSLSVLRTEPGVTIDALEEITLETLARNLPSESPDVDWNIVHDVSRGPSEEYRAAFAVEEMRPTVVVSCFPMREKLARLARSFREGIDLVVPAQRSLPSSLLDTSLKCRSRAHFQLANLQAREILPGSTAALLDPDGYLTEGTSGNLFCVERGTLLTPTARNILPGITRDLVLQLAARMGLRAEETDLTPDRAMACEEMFVTSTSIGILHARSFERRRFFDGGIGPVTLRLRGELYGEVGLDFLEQAEGYERGAGG